MTRESTCSKLREEKDLNEKLLLQLKDMATQLEGNDSSAKTTTLSTSQKLQEATAQIELLKLMAMAQHTDDASMQTEKTKLSTKQKLAAVEAKLAALQVAEDAMQEDDDSAITTKTTASTHQALTEARTQLALLSNKAPPGHFITPNKALVLLNPTNIETGDVGRNI
jgi:hypothetical protein